MKRQQTSKHLRHDKGLYTALLVLFLTACTGTPRPYPLEHVTSENANDRIRFLVMHYTAADFESSLKILTLPSSGPVSAHYLVPETDDPSYPDKALKVYQLVDESRRAWHAGSSRWEDREALNDQSIGIEIVNVAHCHPPMEQALDGICFFPEFDPEQIKLVTALAQNILSRYPDITPTRVVGHGDIQPARKNDPGPRFPWQQLARAGVGAWYRDETVLSYYQRLESGAPLSAHTEVAESDHTQTPSEDERQFAGLLAAYGYGLEPLCASLAEIQRYTRAFQYHFRPERVSGVVDNQTRAILLALLEQYWPEKLLRLDPFNPQTPAATALNSSQAVDCAPELPPSRSTASSRRRQ